MERQTFAASLAQARDFYARGDLPSALAILERLSVQFPAEPAIEGPLKTVRNALSPGNTVSPQSAGLVAQLSYGTALAALFALTALPAAAYLGKANPELDFLEPLAHLFVAAALAYPVALSLAIARRGLGLPASYLLAFLALLATDVAYSAAGEAVRDAQARVADAGDARSAPGNPAPPGGVEPGGGSTPEIEARFQEGLRHYLAESGSPDYAAAVSCFVDAAIAGHRGAQYFLAWCLRNGNGIEKNLDQAFYWWSESASQGLAVAQVEVGQCYRDGIGVAPDQAKAIHWFRQAAEAGNADGQFSLGYAYCEGAGVVPDTDLAIAWYEKAAEQGHVSAQYNLGVLYNDLSGPPVDLPRAVYWFRKAAESGNATAQHNLSCCYLKGKGVVRNYTAAAEWCQKAAEQRFAPAEGNLGWCYEYGEGVAQNHQAAAYWYARAAWKGDAQAQLNLGRLYGLGMGVPENNVLAYTWLGLAATELSEAATLRDGLAEFMTYAEVQSAQRRIAAFVPVVDPQSDDYIYRAPGD